MLQAKSFLIGTIDFRNAFKLLSQSLPKVEHVSIFATIADNRYVTKLRDSFHGTLAYFNSFI